MKKKPVDQYKSPKFLMKFATFAGALSILGGCRSPQLVGDVPNVTPPDPQVQSQDPGEIIELEGDVSMPISPDETDNAEQTDRTDAPNAPEETPDMAGEMIPYADPEGTPDMAGEMIPYADPEEAPIPAGEVPDSPGPEDVTALAGDVPCPTDPGEIPEASEAVESPDLAGDVSISTQPMEVPTMAGGFPSLQGFSPELGAPWKDGEEP